MEKIAILHLRRVLIVTLQVDVDDALALALQEDLTAKIYSSGASGVLIDISALEMVDSFLAKTIANISAMTSILDARTVVVGMRPVVAIILVELGLTLPSVRTALNLERGMQMLEGDTHARPSGNAHA